MIVGNHTDIGNIGIRPIIGGTWTSSVFRNPPLPNGDRELPDICANGQGVNAVGLRGWSRTSFAAPAVAGVAALFQSASPTLKYKPEGCRAILDAGASNLSRNTWWRNADSGIGSFEGSDVLHADTSVSIAKYHFIGEASFPRQIGYSVLTTRELDNNILTQRRLFAPKYYAPSSFYRNYFSICVAIAWPNLPDTEWEDPQSYGLHTNFDLLIRNRDGRQIAASISFDNSYEIVDLERTRHPDPLQIVIRRKQGSVDKVRFAVAWYTSASGEKIEKPPGPDWPPEPPLLRSSIEDGQAPDDTAVGGQLLMTSGSE